MPIRLVNTTLSCGYPLRPVFDQLVADTFDPYDWDNLPAPSPNGQEAEAPTAARRWWQRP